MLDSSFFPDKENRIAEWARLAFTLSLGYDIDSETSEYIMSNEHWDKTEYIYNDILVKFRSQTLLRILGMISEGGNPPFHHFLFTSSF